MAHKFPEIKRLPEAGHSSDPDVLTLTASVQYFLGRQIVVTEKLDGIGVCLTSAKITLKSQNPLPNDSSFNFLRQTHSALKYLIPSNISIFAEYCYSVKNIIYHQLPDCLFVFALRDEYTNVWLPWHKVVEIASELDLPTVPIDADPLMARDISTLRNILYSLSVKPSNFGGPREGLIVRWRDGFAGTMMGGMPFTAKWLNNDYRMSTDQSDSKMKQAIINLTDLGTNEQRK